MIDNYRQRCTPERRKQCQKDNGPWLEAACRRCPARNAAPSPYLEYLLWLRALQLAGYPFDRNDLTATAWCDLGLLTARLNYG